MSPPAYLHLLWCWAGGSLEGWGACHPLWVRTESVSDGFLCFLQGWPSRCSTTVVRTPRPRPRARPPLRLGSALHPHLPWPWVRDCWSHAVQQRLLCHLLFVALSVCWDPGLRIRSDQES